MSTPLPTDLETAPLLLRKGLEEEVYTGTPDGEIVGLSHRIAADLPGFSTEPDARNVEYTTAPYRDYRILIDRLMSKRCTLRRYLDRLDGYTLVPGSTLSLERSDEFRLSNRDNAYYRYIAETYGISVVTASTHINIGIDHPQDLIRAYRVLRCEAPLFLALTASSPFLRGEVTGYHSTRWQVFPHTPKNVPFFRDHQHFIAWVEERIESGEMFNPRHLWLSTRPNGPATPHDLSRLELRVCDRISRPQILAAIVALFEARVWQVLEDPELDPLSRWDDAELRRQVAENEASAAKSSLEGQFLDWQTGQPMPTAELVARYLEQLRPTARTHGFASYLEPVATLLAEGNLAQQWLRKVARGMTPQEVLREAIFELTVIDREYTAECPEPSSTA